MEYTSDDCLALFRFIHTWVPSMTLKKFYNTFWSSSSQNEGQEESRSNPSISLVFALGAILQPYCKVSL